ncbi:amylo-alpha-1,6-glucosidase [Chelatococcus asaccharovorans]|uniref:Trehalase n=1 Tax=Chelatococcus asaccharovorans TaxID=28210 RepID=A0A2V3TWN6_9HYPH|nr:trehalase family glycosidase [Chelatococcus asaccharovorans]MBS7706778.1 neutral trehalase [Chelatococcus asaccharovorans]PXW54077.1 trehalase [Chelatococcus asaccharovorans]CAH1648930.1 Trehalase [Chelatococcus asaccharovorans]CAH1691174.1 Trehalase [Chelatococcus asaccharovorans]
MTSPIDIQAARDVLLANDRGGYTVPTSRLYPFQWNWDSAFVAMGWATFDEERAWRELERLIEGQWDDGMVPHIVFHAPSDDYFPGPDVWGTHHEPPTSGISQPPVFAIALRVVLEGATDPGAAARARPLYQAALASHRWWANARDPEGTGLVAILHPWESGMDNSPAWDEAFARVPPEPTTEIRRRDTAHVGAAMRPHDDDYRRFIYLVDLYSALGWDPAAMWEKAPFKVADVAINAILQRAEQDLLHLAGLFGSDADRQEIAARIAKRAGALAGLWNAERAVFQPRDLITGALVDVATSAGFLPLYAGVPSLEQAQRMAAEIKRWRGKVAHGVPSTSPFDPRFEPKRYWRGPVWGVVNSMIAEGLAAYGLSDGADAIRSDTRALIAAQGFAEYFDPTTGEGLGGGSFSWTAAIALLLSR